MAGRLHIENDLVCDKPIDRTGVLLLQNCGVAALNIRGRSGNFRRLYAFQLCADLLLMRCLARNPAHGAVSRVVSDPASGAAFITGCPLFRTMPAKMLGTMPHTGIEIHPWTMVQALAH